jgi:hypothetical protein
VALLSSFYLKSERGGSQTLAAAAAPRTRGNDSKRNLSEKKIDVYEIFCLGGGSGDWNATQNSERDLFMVRRENGRWHIVRDWLRSIYEVRSGYHARLPLDDTRPFWERYALMSYWIRPEQDRGLLNTIFWPSDPAWALGDWRGVKLLRGLLRHPRRHVRLAACLAVPSDQDECVNTFSRAEWESVRDDGVLPREPYKWDANRERYSRDAFDRSLFGESLPPADLRYASMDRVRIFTTINHPTLRREFCRKFMAKFPNDTDNGCPADKTPPATIVTENGDVPLLGNWR